MSQNINYGIDLGTTNSCIALCEGANVRVFRNNDQMDITPSAVRVLKTGRTIVGRRAYSAIVEDPDNIATEFKRWIGQKDKKTFPSSGRVLSAEELSAEVLKSLLEDVRRQTGENVNAAVITVPAAFGALQCEATARAASSAGLNEYPLLQEPIAAAVAYGMKPGSRDQRWLVFDLGGGTLDIAIVSTREGRLNVLEHRGNNLLGGKDIDRAIIDTFFWPVLAEKFSLPDASKEPEAYHRLRRRVALKAEEAKIDLSTLTEVTISLFDLGSDQEGTPIEVELTLSRTQIEHQMEALIEKCLSLADEALVGARISGADLDRILLVGGPTQMPIIRTALAQHLGAKVDHSLDPMTVVAWGAAVFASTVERFATAPEIAVPPGKAKFHLAFDPVSSSLQSPVAGRVEDSARAYPTEVKIDAEGGYWTSGWLPVTNGLFETFVTLQEGKLTRFWLYARNASGQLLDVEPSELSVRHGLVVGAPPLPHSISVEVVGPDGRPELDPVFKRSTPLPSQNTFKYRALRTLRPSEPESSLAIKLWEGEAFTDPQANLWVGQMLITSDQVPRPIREGSEVELTIRIDASRLITVEAFVPELNQHFSERVYVPQRDEHDYSELVKSLPDQVGAQMERLKNLETLPELDEADGKELERLRREIEDIDIAVRQRTASQSSEDPDEAKQLVEGSRETRIRLSRLEQKAGANRWRLTQVKEAEALAGAALNVVEQLGSPQEKREIAILQRQMERAISKEDERGLRKTAGALDSLRWRVLFNQDWFWREIFDLMSQPGHQFLNQAEAAKWLSHGAQAVRDGDGERLREAVRELWKLQPKTEVEKDRERVVHSGLRRY